MKQDKLKELGYNDYSHYLLSKHWRKLRKKKLRESNHVCAKCGTNQNLHVHHLTYERIGREELDDLMVLCQSCHADIHKKWKPKRKKHKKSSNHDQFYAARKPSDQELREREERRRKRQSEQSKKKNEYLMKRKERAENTQGDWRKPDCSSPFRFL